MVIYDFDQEYQHIFSGQEILNLDCKQFLRWKKCIVMKHLCICPHLYAKTLSMVELLQIQYETAYYVFYNSF